jgi:hypothetical protein
MAAFLTIGGRREGLAQATPEAAQSGPKRYTLKGGEIELVYVPAASGTEAQLDYRDASGTRSFTGDDLSIEISPALGRLVSAALEYVADGYDKYLTLLVPDVNPEENGASASIQTVAIITKHLTTIGGPALIRGALQTYEVVELEGVAEFATG